MSSNDEYIYRLGLDYSQFSKASNDLLTLLGKVDEAMVGRITADARKMSREVSGALAAVDKSLGKTTGMTAAEKSIERQRKQVAALSAAYGDAATKYAKFTRNTARGLQKPGGLNPERQSTVALQRLQTNATALRANGAPVDSALSSAVNRELAARAAATKAAQANRAREAAAAARAAADEIAASAKATAREIADSERKAAAAEKAAQRNSEAAVAAAIAIRRADDSAYRSGVASANSATKQRIAAKQREYAEMVALDAKIEEANRKAAAVQQGRRMAGSGGPLQTQATRAGDTISPTYRPTDYATQRNTAARNGAADPTASSNQTLASMRAFYGEQERAGAANEKFRAAIQDEYQRQLPRFRYALYDVSNASRIAGTALVAGGTAVIATAADYQHLYAQVQRTSGILTDPSLTGAQRGQQFAQLRQDLVDLSKQIPVTFADITTIATLGNQLGIASGNITSFTRTVAEFSAVTNVGVDEAATAFGRLGELLNNTDYRGIGDQIAYLGVKSVATEADIIKTSTQLAVSLQSLNTIPQGAAGAAAQVKETTAATLALSTTVAGLGVKPEQARGTFIRAFGSIGQAVASGGAALNDFGRISGLGSEKFRTEWEKGGTSAYNAFLAFTQGLGSNTAQINSNLSSIGITAVRDRQTLGLLAQNGKRAFDDLKNASGGAADGFLDKSFGVQAQTVTSQLQLLGNQVLALFDSIGTQTLGPVLTLVHALQGMVGYLDGLTSSPAVAWSLALGAGIMVAVGAILLGVSAAGRFSANMIALQQVVADTSISGGVLSGVWAAMTGNAARLTGQTTALTGALDAEGLAQARAGAAGGAGAAGLGKAAGAASKLSSAIGKVGLAGFLISLALSLPAVGKAIRDWVLDIQGATPSVDKLATAVENLGNKQADQAKSTLTKGTSAFGSKPKADDYRYEQQQTVGGYTMLTPVKNSKGTNTISAGRAAANGIGAGQQLLKGQTLSDNADVETATKQIQAYDGAITQLYQGGNLKGAAALLKVYMKAMKDSGTPTDVAEMALQKYRAALGATGDESLADAEKQKVLADATTDAADAFSSALSTLFDYSVAAQGVTDDLTDLGNGVRDNGAAVTFSGAKMKQAITDIYASTDDTAVAKGRLQSLYDQLIALGYAKPLLTGLAGAISQITGPATESKVDIDAFTQGLKSNTEAQKEQKRTLEDYANDLQTTFARSYDLRFGNQNALDKITSGWRDMTSSIKDSRDELRKAKADLASLKSDRSVTEYQLGVANQFGDTARAATLRAQLAQQNSDIRDKQKDVTDARTKGSTALTGNSDAALRNRQGLQGQIQSSQSYIQSLASGGASKKELEAATAAQKAAFIKQATAMGFSKKEVTKLAAAYDDMNQIIGAVPSRVTTHISSNASPAKKAIAEYKQSLDDLDGTTATTTVRQAFVDQDGVPVSAAERADIIATQKSQADAKSQAISKKQQQYRGFRSGGWTGNVPAWQTAGEVHGREFVLNERGAQMFPRAMLDNANRGVSPVAPRVTATATFPSNATMSLGRVERALLASRGGGALTVRSDKIGSALDQAFTDGDRRGSA